jgi:hypothetical protein
MVSPYSMTIPRVIFLGLLAYDKLDLARAGVALDPVENFCRRIGHSSVYKNQTLYINGGLETFVDFGADGQQDWSTITTGISECQCVLGGPPSEVNLTELFR